MKIHVVSFQVPYPADYGGAIDVFYKLKALFEEGFDVVLHTFMYGGRHEEDVLNGICSKVYYYPRETGWRKQFSLLPYIVATRSCPQLLINLCKDDAPILFEGLHTCFYLDHPLLANRKKIVRMHNVEHEYYRCLASHAGWNWKSVYYLVESWKLKRFEKKKLCHADLICAITKGEKTKLEQMVKGVEHVHLPVFFDTTFPTPMPTSRFVLYHGNLAVEENRQAVDFILRHIAPRLPGVLFVIAGRNPRFNNVPRNVQVIADPTDEHLDLLLRTARIHLMLAFQPTGIKLKLINAIVRGNGHILANHDMLYGHSLGRFCIRVDKTQDIIDNISNLINNELEDDCMEKRKLYIQKMKKGGISRLSLFK